MNTSDLLNYWSNLSFDEIETQIKAGEEESTVEQLFGTQEMNDIHAYLDAPSARGFRDAVVLLPGFMGSLLSSVRGVTALLWINPAIFLKGQSSYLELNESGDREKNPAIDIVPTGIEKIVYLKIALALKRQTDLFEFPYDWRRPIESNGDLLKSYIDRWAETNPNQQFTLVGHSMGGLVSRAYMARHPAHAERHIKHLIMHGTPHYGAAAAVENLVLGNRMMEIAAKINTNNETRRLLLNMPSVYQLIPSPPELFPSHRSYPVNWDLYRAENWQITGLRQDYLDAGRDFHKLLIQSDPQIEIIEIAGCHLDTAIDVRRSFDANERVQYDIIRLEEGPDSGDGTVPLWSAILPNAKIYYIQEVHRTLPRNKDVIEATLALIHGGYPDLPTELPERKTGIFGRDMLAPVEKDAEDLRAKIEQGNANEEDLSQLYFGL